MDVSVSIPKMSEHIFLIRGKRVMLDVDLANIYGVTTKHLNQQVRRNQARFPEDFMFQLTALEDLGMRSHFATASKRNIRHLPLAFTEHGAVMLAGVLKTPAAVQASVAIARAFVRLREILGTHRNLAKKLGELETRITGHDAEIRRIFDAIRDLMDPESEPPPKIGFRPRGA